MSDPKATVKLWRKLRPVFTAAVVGAAIGVLWVRLHAGTTEDRPHSLHDVFSRFAGSAFPPGMVVSALFLVAFSIYWEIAAASKSENKSTETAFSRGIHLTLLSAGQVLLVFPVPGLRTRFLPDSTTIVIAGLVVEAAGILFAVWARLALGRNWNAAVALKVDHELIRSGPYRLARHPIYTGVLALYFGIMLVSGEVHAPLGLLLICFAYWRKIRQEERLLEGVFGSAYDEYRRSTRAVIPGLL